MLLADDILLFPVRSILWILKEIHNAAQEELTNEAAGITDQLSHLYMMLETGKISEEEFNSQERMLLDRLDEIEARGTMIEEEDAGRE